ncbi:hypothetical protein SAMN02745119_00586 [Trichlorobacter thiogenes]|uniref:Uncharacterized protein n=1 Tax=Trichlorobacter thiogenes TaxID=115783 RepID=A0A1T4KJ85_9BACT|nr:hypothetical protein SAMN02745119_00586 [Trichlorobacter thiogenes]
MPCTHCLNFVENWPEQAASVQAIHGPIALLEVLEELCSNCPRDREWFLSK